MSRLIFNKFLSADYEGIKQGRLKFYNWTQPWKLGGKIAPTWKDIILHGVTALTLVNSKPNGLNYLKLFGGTELLPEIYIDSVTLEGKCEQNGTPTPDNPVDIVCNNGVIKYGQYGKNLLDMSSEYIVIGKYINNSGIEQSNTSNFYNSKYIPVKPNTKYTITTSVSLAYVSMMEYDSSKAFITRTLMGDGTSGTVLSRTFTTGSTTAYVLLGSNPMAKAITLEDVLAITWQFEEGATSTPYEPYHFGVHAFGTVETITSTGKNLLNADVDNKTIASTPTSAINIDFNMWYKGMAYNGYANTHSITNFSCGKGMVSFASNSNGYGCARFIKLKPNTQYTVSCANPTDEHKCAIMCYIDNGDGTYTPTTYIKTPAKLPYQFTTNNNAVYGLDFYSPTDTLITYSNIQLEESSVVTSYEPYYNGGTATAKMLLSVGNYKDTQEVLSGVVTRNVGVLVLDGVTTGKMFSSAWNATYKRCNLTIPDMLISVTATEDAICNLFPYSSSVNTSPTSLGFCTNNGYLLVSFIGMDNITSANEANTWLAEQYANGTPVIVVYPLATATTETVSGQVLNKEPLTVTGSLSGLVATVVSSTHTTPTPTQPLAINCNNGVLKTSSQLLVNGNCKENVNNWTVSGLTYNNTNDYISFTNNTNAAIYLRCSTNNVRKENHVYAYLITGKIDSGTTGWGSRNVGAAPNNPLTTTEQTLVFIDTFPANGNGEPWIYIQTARTFTLNKKSGFRIYDLTALGLAGIITTPEQVINYFGNKYEEPKTAITEGTVETVEVTGKNLFDKATFDFATSTTLKYIPIYVGDGTFTMSTPDFGVETSANLFFLAGSVNAGANSRVNGVWTNNAITQTAINGYVTVATRTGSSTLDKNPADYNWQIEKGSIATEYEPYFDGGSATAEMLLKLLDKGGNSIYAQDVQNVTTGGVTRNVGTKVFDGTETWNRGSNQDASGNYVFYMSLTGRKIQDTAQGSLCSHFKFRGTVSYSTMLQDEFCINQTIQYIYFDGGTRITIDEWKAYLAEQYRNGTPVIVIYTLATPTTETVTAQPLTIRAGTNIIEITQASMDNLELEVSYKAGVEVTVTEIENAQLDNSVEVTVNG